MSNLDSTLQPAEPGATAASVPVSNGTRKRKRRNKKKKEQEQQGPTPDLGSKAAAPEGMGVEAPVAANGAASAPVEGAPKLKEEAEMKDGGVLPEDKAATTAVSGPNGTRKRKKRNKMNKKNKEQEQQGPAPDLGSKAPAPAPEGMGVEAPVAANVAASAPALEGAPKLKEDADMKDGGVPEDKAATTVVSGGTPKRRKRKVKKKNKMQEILESPLAVLGVVSVDKIAANKSGNGCTDGVGTSGHADVNMDPINGEDPSCAQSVANGADDLVESKAGIHGSNSCSENNGLLQESSAGRKKRKRKRNRGSSNRVEAHKEKIKSIYSPRGSLVRFQRKKLLILDLNGLLADINQDYHNAHMAHAKVRAKLVFIRPHCHDFLRFCFQNFELGIWSSRKRENVNSVVNILMRDLKEYLLFCWDMSYCTVTGCNTIDNKHKPLVLKELKKLWNKEEASLPWEQGEFSPSNTLLVDDSPYKALCNPPNTAIFPYPYSYLGQKDDCSLGPGGDLRVYLERIAAADNVQNFVRDNPFGQKSITESDTNWDFYAKIVDKVEKSKRLTGMKSVSLGSNFPLGQHNHVAKIV